MFSSRLVCVYVRVIFSILFHSPVELSWMLFVYMYRSSHRGVFNHPEQLFHSCLTDSTSATAYIICEFWNWHRRRLQLLALSQENTNQAKAIFICDLNSKDYFAAANYKSGWLISPLHYNKIDVTIWLFIRWCVIHKGLHRQQLLCKEIVLCYSTPCS